MSLDPHKLRKMREARLMTQAELADAIGVAHSTISRIETGAAEPRYSTIRKLARALHVIPAALLRDTELYYDKQDE